MTSPRLLIRDERSDPRTADVPLVQIAHREGASLTQRRGFTFNFPRSRLAPDAAGKVQVGAGALPTPNLPLPPSSPHPVSGLCLSPHRADTSQRPIRYLCAPANPPRPLARHPAVTQTRARPPSYYGEALDSRPGYLHLPFVCFAVGAG